MFIVVNVKKIVAGRYLVAKLNDRILKTTH